MKAAVAILALTLGGCVSHTAAIGEAASDVRTDVAVAKEHSPQVNSHRPSPSPSCCW
jgi:outer membrane murein-binding lipoprotein Lpp